MNVSISDRDMLAKIGELLLINDALDKRVRELEAEAAARNRGQK